MYQRKSRHGFTLVELLVVIAIITLLMAMLLPAVQMAREAANKMRCGNNLKQMGIAIHHFYGDYNFLPQGGNVPWSGIWRPGPGEMAFDPPNQGAGWAFQILRYMEQDAVRDCPVDWTIQTALVPFYFCPSRRFPTHLQNTGRAGMDYCGTTPGKGPWTWDQFWYGTVWVWNPAAPPANVHYKGVIIRTCIQERIGLTSGGIPDGTSNTMMVSEKWLNSLRYEAGDWHDDAGWSDGWDPDIMRYTAFPPIKDSNGSPYGWDGYMVGSAHPAGVNALFADGSVRGVHYDIDLTLFNHLGDRMDGTVIDLSDI
jgi:prepilin-type N-terminal cleavage/methylation domain-containing protein/prepilin-type processing-associated H-X9-DG protein